MMTQTSDSFDVGGSISEADIPKMMALAEALTGPKKSGFYKSILFGTGKMVKFETDEEVFLCGHPTAWDTILQGLPDAQRSTLQDQVFGIPSFGIPIVDLDADGQNQERQRVFLAYAKAVTANG